MCGRASLSVLSFREEAEWIHTIPVIRNGCLQRLRHGISGLGAAVSWLEEKGLDVLREIELKRMRQFYEGVSRIPGVTVYGDFSSDRRCPIVSLNIGDYDSSEVSDELSVTYGIVTRPGAHCAPLMHRALGTTGQGAVRFSFSHYNTEEEVETAIQAIKELVNDQ